jgi:hypothetical protein
MKPQQDLALLSKLLYFSKVEGSFKTKLPELSTETRVPGA